MTRRIAAAALLFVGAVAGLAAPAAAAGPAGDGNIIGAVRVEEAQGAVRVVVDGSATPSFTVFRLANPERVFIDIAGARVDSVLSPLRVDNGVVDQVVTMQLHDERKTVGRVIVGLEQAAPYRVRAEGSQLVMEIAAQARKRPQQTPSAQQRELQRLEDEVRARLAASEQRLQHRRRALEAELGAWQGRRDEARTEAQAQEQRVRALTGNLEDASRRLRLLERALEQTRAEQESLKAARQDEAAKLRLLAEARTRSEQLTTAAAKAQEDLQQRMRAADTAVRTYEQAKEHLEALRKETSSAQSGVARLQADQVRLQQARLGEEERLASLRQHLRQAEQRRAAAEQAAAAADRRRVEAERAAEVATGRRAEAERTRSVEQRAARAAEQQRIAELELAVRSASEQRAALQAAIAHDKQRTAALAKQRQAEERRVLAVRKASEEEETRLEQLRAASAKAAEAAKAAEGKLSELRLAEQRAQERAQAAAKHTAREEERAARVSAERKRLEAVTSATAEAARREVELATATAARAKQSTAASREQEMRARAALAAAQAHVAQAEQEASAQRAEAAQLSERIATLRGEERSLRQRLATQQREGAARGDSEALVKRLRRQAEAAVKVAAQTRVQLERARTEAARFAQAEARERATRSNLEELQRRLVEMETHAGAQAGELQQTRAQAASSAQRAKELERQLAAARATGEAGGVQIARLEAQLQAAEAEAARLREQSGKPSAQAQAELAALRSELERLRAEQLASKQALAEAQRLAAEARKATPEPDQVVAMARQAAELAATPAARRGTTTPAGAARRAGPAMQITDVRFEDATDRSLVVVQHTGPADFMLREGEGGAAILHLDGASLPRALERTLDTSQLSSPVRSVSAFGAEGSAGEVRLVVNLFQPSESFVRRVADGTLHWTFLKPGAEPQGGMVMGPDAAERGSRDGAFAFSESFVAGAQGEDAPAEGAAKGARRRSPGARTRFTGKRITLDLRSADIHNVLRLLAKEGRINIIASEQVSGTLTLHLERIPWDQALDVILKTKGLAQTREGDIIWITPISTMREQQKMQVEVKKARTELEPLEVRLVTINYSDPKALEAQAKALLSERGAVSTDARTKTVIIKDVPDHALAIEDLLRRLDTQTPVVLIEGRIVEVSTNHVRDFGIQWGGDFNMGAASGNPTGLRFPSVVGVSGGADERTLIPEGVTQNPNFVVNLPAAAGGGSGGALGLTLGSLGGTANLSVRLSALEEEGALRIISSPRITTMDATSATISQGVSIPIAVVSAQGVNTVFFDANLELRVTPNVTQDGHVVLNVLISKNTPDFSNTGARGDPSIQRKQAQTTMMIKDGDTTVIGGIFTHERSETMKKVPFFGDIPILGSLFSFRANKESRAELLIFITPRIVNRSEAVVETGRAAQGVTFR